MLGHQEQMVITKEILTIPVIVQIMDILEEELPGTIMTTQNNPTHPRMDNLMGITLLAIGKILII